MAIFHGYLVLLSTFLLNFVSIGVFNSCGLFLGPIRDTFPSTGEAVSALYVTIQIVVALLSSLGGGMAQDSMNQNNIALGWLFASGGSFIALGLLWSSIAASFTSLLFGALLMGTGLGLTAFMAGGVCVLWFDKQRGSMLLLAMSGMGLGSIICPTGVAWLLAKSAGEDPWRPTMRAVGLVSILICLVSSKSMKLPEPGEVEEHEKSASLADAEKQGYGAVPDSESQKKVAKKKKRISSAVALTDMQKKKEKRASNLGSFQAIGLRMSVTGGDFLELEDLASEESNSNAPGLREVVLSRTSVMLILLFAFTSFSYLNLQVYLPSYIVSVGLPAEVGGKALSFLGAGLLFGNILLGPAVDALGAILVTNIAFCIMGVLSFVWPYCTTAFSLYVFSAVFGFCMSTQSSMPIIILADAYGESSSEHILTLNGIMNIFKGPGYLFGPTAAGLLIQESHSYFSMANLSGLVTLAGCVFLTMTPSPEVQKKTLYGTKGSAMLGTVVE